MQEIKIKTEYITVGQFIKFIGLISQGSDVKLFLSTNKVLIDNEVDNRRGRKIYKNSIVKINELTFKVI